MEISENVVYVDLYFLVNFSMDFLCLFLTAKLMNLKFSTLRGIIAASFGGIYANAILFVSLNWLAALALNGISCLALCAIAFLRRGEWRRIFSHTLVFAAISMVLGGFMTALFSLFNRIPIFDAIKLSDGDGISVWLFALLALISGCITFLGGRVFSSKMARKSVYVSFTFGGRSVRLSAFVDNGNLLRDPIGGKPCIVADAEALSELLPKDILSAARSGDMLMLEDISEENKKRVLLIPAHTAFGEGMLVGIRMDRICIEDRGSMHEADAVVALSRLGDHAEGAEALIPACLLV